VGEVEMTEPEAKEGAAAASVAEGGAR
jgi:hypothetical protein